MSRSTISTTATLQELCVNAIRVLAMDAVQRADSGHPGTPMGLAPLAYVLWTRHLRYNPADPSWRNRDRVVLSAGHASMLLYAVLYLTGYDLPLEEIENFRQWGSRAPGHPEYGHTPGIEATTGPLGQGIGDAVGMAIAEAHLAAEFNRGGHEVVDHRTYVIASDGDLMEGISHEAAALAGHLALGKLIAFYDDNHITIEGATSLADSTDAPRRFESYGWHVQSVPDGNDIEAIDRAIREAQSVSDRPSLIVLRTHIAYGSPHKQDTADAHGSPLGEEEVALTRKNLGWPVAESFAVPDEVLTEWRACRTRGEQLQGDWESRFAVYAGAHPDHARELERRLRRELPDGWDRGLPTFTADNGAIATREASAKVLNAIASAVPELMGGAADLAPSTKTLIKESEDFSATNRSARNMRFGIREHAMGAVLNGMALHGGIIPYGATFLIFSDYMRPPMRLASMMGQQVIYVFTHDSIGLGEDGPTHQPIEQLAGLRAVPGLVVLRPADAGETVEAWRVAIERRDAPTALALTRQTVPFIDRERFAPAAGVRRGAYVLSEADGGTPELILMASGSEVQIVLAAQDRLRTAGIRARVVSVPSLELFADEGAAYREHVLPNSVRNRIAVEAAHPMPWYRWAGDGGEVIGLERFGASAPYQRIYQELGLTTERVVERAQAMVGHAGTRRPMRELQRIGQSVWLDYLRRGMTRSGELASLIADGLCGMTSNPTIFENAIAHSSDYDDVLGDPSFAGQSDRQLFESVAVTDVQEAADRFRSVYDQSSGGDGFVSIEVSPELARDTDGSIAEARRLWAAVNRPNVMVKIPGTREGWPAIEQCLRDGININITLLFSLEHYHAVADAYLRALEARVADGQPINRVASVASLFVSRVDTEVDTRLATKGGAIAELRGQVAIANARLVYDAFLERARDPRWRALAARGARVQRPLWASTGTKNPAYSDVMYVEGLIGPETITTMPPETLELFRDHGVVARTLPGDVAGARRTMDALANGGIDYADVNRVLEDEGIAKFRRSLETLLGVIADKRRALGGTAGRDPRLS